MVSKKVFLSSVILLSLIFSGCGDDATSKALPPPSSTENSTALFIDSPVGGLFYKSQSKEGVTRDNGAFDYALSDINITFKAGNITLGTMKVVDINPDLKLYIQDLVGVSRETTDNAEVLKIATFLQSLDTEENPNVITLDASDLDILNEIKNIEDINITRQLAFVEKTPKSEDNVLEHLGDTIVANGGVYNYRPLVSDSNNTTPQNTDLTTQLQVSDKNQDTFTLTLVTAPTYGIVTFITDTNTFTYKPNWQYLGQDSFTFKAFDGEKYSRVATCNITVNTPPVATAGTLTVIQDSANNTVTLNASDVDGDVLTYIVVTNPIHGILSGSAPNLTYTPTANYNGVDSFTFKVNDGTVDSSDVTVMISVNTLVNNAPIATAGTLTVIQDSANNTVTLNASDVDGDVLTYIVVTNPIHGILSGSTPNLTYTPTANYNGVDSFTFKVNDGTVDSSDATVDLIVRQIVEKEVYVKTTGQTKSYNISGVEVTDNSLKDDGYYKKGTPSNYTRASDMVSDARRNLMWQDNAAAAGTHRPWLTEENDGACQLNPTSTACYNTSGYTVTTYCSDLTLGGYTDWRLPTVTELEGIVDYSKEHPSIDTAYFNHVSSSGYWSSSTWENYKGNAWIVYFDNGDVGLDQLKKINHYVRCVRDGQ